MEQRQYTKTISELQQQTGKQNKARLNAKRTTRNLDTKNKQKQGTGWKRSTSYTPPVQITSPAGVILDMGVRIVDPRWKWAPRPHSKRMGSSNADQRTSAWLNAAKKLPDYLTSITNGMGAKTTIDYEPLSGKKIQIYTKEHNAKYPTQDIQIPLYVVYQTSSDTDRTKPGTGNNQHTTTYHYTGAKLNVLGWGFLGFHTIKTTDQTTGITAITTYSQNVENHTQGIPLSTKIYTGKGTLLTSIQNTTTTKSYGTGAINQSYYYPYISTQTKTSYSLTGKELGTKTTENTEDAYANPTKTKITQKDSTGTYTTTTTNTYKNDAQNWHLGELTKKRSNKNSPKRPSNNKNIKLHLRRKNRHAKQRNSRTKGSSRINNQNLHT